MADGTAAAPGLPFSADPDTGIFRAGANTFNVSTGGVERLEVRADGDVDLTTGASAALRLNGDVFLHQRGGSSNTAVGGNALSNVTTGKNNTASGRDALLYNTTGSYNTASGSFALRSNTTGSYNTASGYALYNNTTGRHNTASGMTALFFNTTGIQNTASGSAALVSNTTGVGNTASGYKALHSNTTGYHNTASGDRALYGNTTGYLNTAIGRRAGYFLTTGDNNIDIGANVDGVAGESDTIRIGSGTTRAFIDGIRGVTTGLADAIPVLIDSDGQLGTISSSRRFKWDIQNMSDASSDLMRLRPVTFRYNQCYADGSHPLQYGLIAEEVAEVYPDLVVRSADGQIETVQYYKLDAMLLNEVQKLYLREQEQAALLAQQATLNGNQDALLAEQDERLGRQQQQIKQLLSRLDALAALLERSIPPPAPGHRR